jgi:hypothetical protein
VPINLGSFPFGFLSLDETKLVYAFALISWVVTFFLVFHQDWFALAEQGDLAGLQRLTASRIDDVNVTDPNKKV